MTGLDVLSMICEQVVSAHFGDSEYCGRPMQEDQENRTYKAVMPESEQRDTKILSRV